MTTRREYGLRPYATSGLTYQEFIRTTPDKGMSDQSVLRHSVFKKPYKVSDGQEETYPEAEYRHDGVNGNTYYPHSDYPQMGTPIPKGEEPLAPETYNCWTHDCCCDGKAMEIHIYCTQPIVFGPYTKSSSGETIEIEKKKNKEGDAYSIATICYTPVDCSMPKKMYCNLEGPSGQIVRTDVTRLSGSGDCSDCADKCVAAIIGFTTQQMSLSESQTLTVNNPESGVTYRWKITAGGGSLTTITGLSTVYTAPSSNANCTNNPTISLYANGCELCNSLDIAVNNPAVTGAAYVSYRIYHYPEASRENVCAKNMIKRLYTCANIATGLPMTIEACCLYSWMCDWGTNCSSCTDALLLSQCAAIEGYSCAANKDARTAEMKEQGCCPAGLL